MYCSEGSFFVLLGDIKQLPPIKDRPFYGTGFNNLAFVEEGQQLYRTIESAVILPASFRQNNEQQRLRELLDRVADGEVTFPDWRTLASRLLSSLDANRFADSVRLFDINSKVHEYNERKLREFQHVYKVKAINNCSSAASAKARDADNLENVLYLAIGARVMLRKNLNTASGLTNGALRTITDIVISEDNEMPLFIMVEFDRQVNHFLLRFQIETFKIYFNLNIILI